MNTIAKYAASYATWQDLTGKALGEDRIKGFIGDLYWGSIVHTIPQLMAMPAERLRRAFISYIAEQGGSPQSVKRMDDYLNDRQIVSSQGLLSVLKWLLAYGKPENFHPYLTLDASMGIAVYLCLAVSDYLHRPGHPTEYEVFQNMAFHYRGHLAATAARAEEIYVRLAQDRALYDPGEYLDINADFQSVHGASITDYLSVAVATSLWFTEGQGTLSYDWKADLDRLFEATALSQSARSLLVDQFVFTLAEGREWASATLMNPWNFSLLHTKPLIEISDGVVIPAAPWMLEDQIFYGLFHKIRLCYSQEDTRFLSFFGRPFEEYIKKIGAAAAAASPLPYQFIPEFSFGSGQGDRSPDVMFRLNDTLLVIEAKGMRMRAQGTIHGNGAVIEGDLQRMFAEPITQAHTVMAKLINGNIRPDLFAGVKELYIVTVSFTGVPTVLPLERPIKAELTKQFTLPVRDVFHLDVEEYELLCHLISRRKPVWRILDNKTRLGSDLSFKNFLHYFDYPMRHPDSVRQRQEIFFSTMQARLFPE